MVWLTTERHTEDGKTVETAQTLGLVEPLRLGTFDFEVREDASFRLVATDRSGEPSRPLHATEPRRPRSGETVEVVVER